MPFIKSTHSIWFNFLSTVDHDIYHLPEYSILDTTILGGKALAWYYKINDIEIIIPLVSRRIGTKNEYFDLSSPYGYPGILCNKNVDIGLIKEALLKFNEEAAGAGYVSTFIRLNPFYNPWILPVDTSYKQVFHGFTVSVNLVLPLVDIRKGYSLNHKRDLRKASQMFYSKVNDYLTFDLFISAYHQTMKRRNASTFYYFSESYFLNYVQY